MAKLGSLQACGDYQLRPPKGYSLQTKQGPNGSTAYAWTTEPRQDGTRGYIMMLLLPAPADTEKHTLDDILDHFTKGIADRRTGFDATAPEHGDINRLPCARTYWSGTETRSGLKMHGFIYVSQSDSTIIEISSQDADPHSMPALALSEASALTFRKGKP